MSFMCDKCSKQFEQVNHLKSHLRFCSGPGNDPNSIKCPACKTAFGSMDMLRNHLESSHDVKLQYEKYSFQTLLEFLDWKTNMEEETDSHYFQKFSASSSGTKRTHLLCNRSGGAISRRFTTFRRKKSIKMDATCPSAMIIIESQSGVDVTFCKTHFGHGSNSQRCLTENEREIIAGKMADGVSMDEILDQFNDMTSNMDDIKIATTKEDLLNIKRDFNGRIISNHQQAQLMKKQIKVLKISDSTWTIESASGRNYVTQEKTVCDLNDCALRCRYCNICTHMYTCDCPDQNRQSNISICKHIHACRLVNGGVPFDYHKRTIPTSARVENTENEAQNDVSEEKRRKIMIYCATKEGCNKIVSE